MKHCHTKFWLLVVAISVLIILSGIFISIQTVIRTEKKVDAISNTLNDWGIE